MMNGRTPHIVQYQGSKRLLASQILKHMPRKFNRLFEPFSGMAAVTIATAKENRAERYHINDINEPVVRILQTAIDNPSSLAGKYAKVWSEQFSHGDGHIGHFYAVRERFNGGEQTAENMLYLLARCVKGSVRYGKNGNFNQSPDKRRHGTSPKNMEKNIFAISAMLKGKTVFFIMRLPRDFRHNQAWRLGVHGSAVPRRKQLERQQVFVGLRLR